MTTVHDFLQYKNVREERAFARLFARANSLDDKLEALLRHKHLQVADHQLFLAFLAYLHERKIDSYTLFRDVLQLPKHTFEARYHMNWGQVVKLSVTFLSILQQNEPESFEQLRDDACRKP